ncbi:hypothetical protein Esti_001024 [Eimeria stiedai]
MTVNSPIFSELTPDDGTTLPLPKRGCIEADPQRSCVTATDRAEERLVDCVECRHKHSNGIRWERWLIVAHAFSLVLLLSICLPARTASQVAGVQRRRLAEGGDPIGDDEEAPSSPDLLDLCSELGVWSPAGSATDTPRRSPVIVESYFASLEGSGDSTSVAGPTASSVGTLKGSEAPELKGSGVKRAISDEAASLHYSALQELSESPVVPPSNTGKASTPAVAVDPEQSFAQASSAPVAPQPTSGQASGGVLKHPFVRAPPLQPGVVPRSFRPEVIAQHLLEPYLACILRKMRELFLKPSLSQEQADWLVQKSEALANHTIHRMTTPLRTNYPSTVADVLGRRFLSLHYLHLASETLQQKWTEAEWWRLLLAAVRHEYPEKLGHVGKGNKADRSRILLAELVAALELYKNGSSPTEVESIKLLRKLFLKPEAPAHFKETPWEAWRSDDKQFDDKDLMGR